jgi:glycosyltransferase involved in cell wall biosynthesis
VNVLVWQWGRRGAGPRIAMELAEAMNRLPGVTGQLSLSNRAEILAGPSPPVCVLPMGTYGGLSGFAWRMAQTPFLVVFLVRRLRDLRPDLAVCAMPGPLDLIFLAALRIRRVPVAVVVHDADTHPGDLHPFMVRLQRVIVRRADMLVTLSAHVADRLREQGLVRRDVGLAVMPHPPLHFGPPPPLPFAHGGPARLLFFGRLLSYKGLDLLADALRLMGPRADLEIRVVGSGPESEVLAALRDLSGVNVENRWVPEHEIGAIIAWSDALVLPYREASQSGAAAAAIAARRFVVATRVGGLIEQVQDYALAELCDPEPRDLVSALGRLLARRTSGIDASSRRPDASWTDFAQAVLHLADAKSAAPRRQ